MTQHNQAIPHNFTTGQGIALADLVLEGCACKPHEEGEIRQAIAEDAALVARIHALVGLLYPQHERPSLLRSILISRSDVLATGLDEGLSRSDFDALLTSIFADAAPRDLFHIKGEVRNRKAEIQILLNILRMRSWHGPDCWQSMASSLPYALRYEDEYEERLARSVRSALAANASEDAEKLLIAAIADGDEEVRCTALEAAPRFVESYEVRQLLSSLDEDESDRVRRLAIDALASLIESWEVAERIFWFTDDPNPQIRLRALTLILENHWAADHYDAIARHAFSPYPEIVRTIRTYFSDEEIQRLAPGRQGLLESSH